MESGFRVGDEAVMAAYQSESAFQVDGKFNETAAKGMLAQIGLSPAAYERQLAKQRYFSRQRFSHPESTIRTKSSRRRRRRR